MFIGWPKIPRYENDSVVITEKIDGTNACVIVAEKDITELDNTVLWYEFISEVKILCVYAQSRTRIITPDADNFGFATWVTENGASLSKLGCGYHYGEWWGNSIQRNYGLTERRFSLFSAGRWSDPLVRPTCCHCVPVLYAGKMNDSVIDVVRMDLVTEGSVAVPGYQNPEGFVIYFTQSKRCNKVIINK